MSPHHFSKHQFSFVGRTPQNAWNDARKYAKKEERLQKLYRILIFGYLLKLIVERKVKNKSKFN